MKFSVDVTFLGQGGKIKVYGIQYGRTDHTKSSKKREIKKVLIGLRNYWKTVQTPQTAWFWQFFIIFLYPITTFLGFLGGLCVICVVILNTINLYFMTIFFRVPPWLKKVTYTEKCKNVNVPQNVGRFFKLFFFTCVSHIFDFSGNTKYEHLSFMTRLNLQCWTCSSWYIILKHVC